MKKVLQALWAPDLWLAALATLVTGVLIGTSSRGLESSSWMAAGAISAGFTLAGLNIVSMRWVSDRAKGSSYGEVIRLIDPGESNLSLPYWIVTLACFGLAGLGFAGYALDGEMARSWAVAYYTLVTFFSCYSLFGSVALLRLTRWHHRQSAILQAAEEEASRRSRAALKRGGDAEGKAE